MTNKKTRLKTIGLLLLVMLLLAACGGDEADSNATPEPTKTPLPEFEYIEPTLPAVFSQDSTEEASSDSGDGMELDPTLVERGLGRYEALECGICHGVDGDGTDEIGGLLEFSMEEDAFVTFMRSGGDIGNSHQYSTDRLSKNGATNLYQYLVSLTQGE